MVNKKRKREDKAKTQLKKPKTAPGKHLPKGTNVTKTDFRVAKISIPGQKGVSSQDGPTTTKKIGMKEVLNKLGHFSLATRTDGLEGLKDLLSGPYVSSLVSGNLSSLLTALIPLSHEIEKKLRKLSVPLLAQIFSHTTALALAPLHSLLSAHLGCALTHIDPRIQQDGLVLLDSMLEQAPGFIRDNYLLVLPNCLDQISAKKKPGESGSGPHLAANMSEGMTALKWRLSVLTRVDRIFDIVLETGVDENIGSGDPVETVSTEFLLGNPCLLAPRPLGLFLPLSSLSPVTDSSSVTDLADLLLPLLMETWVEARANDDHRAAKGSLLSKDSAEMFNSVTGVLDKLVMITDSHTCIAIKDRFLTDIRAHLLNCLPYHCTSQSCDEANTQLGCVGLSLDPAPQPGMLEVLVTVVTAKGQVRPSTRLRLLEQLVRGQADKLSGEQRERCMSTLVSLTKTSVQSAAVRLLEERAVVWSQSDVVTSWVGSLPSQVIGLLSTKEVEGKQLGRLLDTCLALAKTRNIWFVKQWREIHSNHEGNFGELDPNVNWRLKCIKFHVERTCLQPITA